MIQARSIQQHQQDGCGYCGYESNPVRRQKKQQQQQQQQQQQKAMRWF
jgi:hypothetical protein